MTTLGQAGQVAVPDAVARAVMLPASYGDVAGTVHPAAAWLREHAPIARAEIDGYDPVWLLSRHADIKAVLRQAELFHNADVNIMLQPQAGDAYLRELLGGRTNVFEHLSFMEPPEHTAHRAAVAHSFLPAQIRRFAPRFREIAKASVDRLLEHDGEADFVSVVSSRFPLEAVLEMLGVPPEDYDYLLKLTQDSFGGDDPDWKREEIEVTPEAMAKQFHAAVQDAYAYFEVIRLDRHAHPREDLATALVTARLPDGELQSARVQNHAVCVIALAGHDTTNSALSGGVHGLASFPDQFAKVRADPSLVPGLVEEALRWSTPARHFMRNASRDTELDGLPIRAMDRLMCLFISGNFDDRAFPDPHRFDVTRRPNPHLTFSDGPHVCIGQHLAKLEMRALFEELVPRLRTLELAAEPTLKLSNFVSGFKTLPIRFTKA